MTAARTPLASNSRRTNEKLAAIRALAVPLERFTQLRQSMWRMMGTTLIAFVAGGIPKTWLDLSQTP
jgi:hypothetical protein